MLVSSLPYMARRAGPPEVQCPVLYPSYCDVRQLDQTLPPASGRSSDLASGRMTDASVSLVHLTGRAGPLEVQCPVTV